MVYCLFDYRLIGSSYASSYEAKSRNTRLVHCVRGIINTRCLDDADRVGDGDCGDFSCIHADGSRVALL